MGESSTMAVRVGVFGAGFARTAILPALATIGDVEVVGVASARLESARRAADQFGVDAAYDDWRALLAEQSPDLVCIVTPTHLHAEMAIASLETGANVLCEKPMAMDRHEAAGMLAAAQRAGRIALIDHELRFNPNRREIARILAAGEIGEVRHVELINVGAGFGDPASRRQGDWLSLTETGGGRLGANGSHQVDLLRWWFGEVSSVSARLATLVPERRDPQTGSAWRATADDFVTGTIEMESGVIATMTLSSVARHELGASIRVFGSEGTLIISDTDERLLRAAHGADFEDITVADPNARRHGIAQRVWNVSVVALLEELVAAIAEGRQPIGAATFEDGLRCQEVLDAMRLSSLERRWVDVRDVRMVGVADEG